MTRTEKIPVTASTKIGEQMVEKTMHFDCPVWDAGLQSLLAYYNGDSKALFRDWLEGCFKIEKADVVRKAIKAEHGNGVSKPKKPSSVLKQLGLE